MTAVCSLRLPLNGAHGVFKHVCLPVYHVKEITGLMT